MFPSLDLVIVLIWDELAGFSDLAGKNRRMELNTLALTEGQLTLPQGVLTILWLTWEAGEGIGIQIWFLQHVVGPKPFLHRNAAAHPLSNLPSPREGQKFAQRISGEGGWQRDRFSNSWLAARPAFQQLACGASEVPICW